MQNHYYMHESTTNLIRLSQRMRKEKRIDLLDSNNGDIIQGWNAPFSTDLKVREGIMFNGDINISFLFWEELYWLYYYFNTQYKYVYNDDEYDTFDGSEDEYDNSVGSEEQFSDFISFITNTHLDYEDEIDPYVRHPNYIAKNFQCNFIYRWIMFKLEIDLNADVDNTLMMDLKYVGEILPTITWKAGGLIVPLFGTQYYDLIEGSIQSLVSTYENECVEDLIVNTIDHTSTRQFNRNTFWQHQFRKCSNDVGNVEVTKSQLLNLLECFKRYGLNVLTLEQVREQSLACHACPRSVTFERIQGVRILIEMFGFEVLAFPGDYQNKSLPMWDWERYPPLISSLHITYVVLRSNVDFIEKRQSYV